jgi:glyoxylase I family protein
MTVSDLDASLGFYCDRLGLTLRLRRTTPGGEVAFLDAGGGQLEIVCPAAAVSTPARRVGAGEAGLRHLTFAVEDVDATFARLTAAGVPAPEAPRDARNRDVFTRVAFVLDPDGIVVELAERAPPPATSAARPSAS